jgi:hypothetical protein
MKKVSTGVLITAFFFSLICCTKTNNINTTIHDSTTVIVRDTIVKRDTVILTTTKNPIVGEWVGTFHIDGTATANLFYYKLEIRADSTVYTTGESGLYDGNTTYAAGPWKLLGTAFSASVTALDSSHTNVQTLTANYDSTSGILGNGVYIDVTGSTQTGTFTLTRVP